MEEVQLGREGEIQVSRGTVRVAVDQIHGFRVKKKVKCMEVTGLLRCVLLLPVEFVLICGHAVYCIVLVIVTGTITRETIWEWVVIIN